LSFRSEIGVPGELARWGEVAEEYAFACSTMVYTITENAPKKF